MNSENRINYLLHPSGSRIAYQQIKGSGPTLVFLSGFRSDMNGDKATALSAYCHKSGRNFIRFDYSGHGLSDGKFIDCTLSDWLDDVLLILDNIAPTPAVLIGSSMGGWLAILCAKNRPEKIQAIIGLAAAPDFTIELLLSNLSAEQKKALQKCEEVAIPDTYDNSSYLLKQYFFTDSQKHLLLQQDIPLQIPVRLIHGMSDTDIPWETAIRLQEKITGTDVEVHLIKNGDHRLSTKSNLGTIIQQLECLLSAL